MLDNVDGIRAKPPARTEIYGQRAIANHRVECLAEAINIEAICGDGLPGKFAASTEASDIADKRKLSVFR